MLHSLYAMSDLCVIPSLYEPFGLVALEAMASGCPCIVADTGGLREVVPGGERVGLRFRARDSESLAERVETLLTDDELRDRLVAEASEHILSFDWADVARQTAEVYAEPAARRSAGGVAERLQRGQARARRGPPPRFTPARRAAEAGGRGRLGRGAGTRSPLRRGPCRCRRARGRLTGLVSIPRRAAWAST